MDKKRKTLILVSVIVVVLLLCALFLLFYKQESYRIIKIVNYTGNVIINRQEKEFEVFEDLQLEPEDKITSDEKATIELLADEDKHMAVSGSSSFIVHAKGKEDNGNITIELLYGYIDFNIENKLPEKSSFIVNTPNATMSVRGTQFYTYYNKDKNYTYVNVSEGTVWVESNGETFILNRGDEIQIDDTGAKAILLGLKEGETYKEASYHITRAYVNRENYQTYEAIYRKGPSDNKEVLIDDTFIDQQENTIEEHLDEINLFYENNKDEAFKVLLDSKSGFSYPGEDITDWFSSEMTVDGTDGKKHKFFISNVMMYMSIGSQSLKDRSLDDVSYYFSEIKFVEGKDGYNYYEYLNGVRFYFYGKLVLAE